MKVDHEYYQDVHGYLTEAAWIEPPLFRGANRLFIESGGIERTPNSDVVRHSV